MSKRIVHTDQAPAPFQGAPYSQGVVHGDLVFVAGQIGVDPQTGQVVEGGIEAQTEQAMREQRVRGFLESLRREAEIVDHRREINLALRRQVVE